MRLANIVVFRIQDDLGYGMYHTENSSVAMDLYEDSHLSPKDDEGLQCFMGTDFRMTKHKFGFANIQQLKRWLTKEQRENLAFDGLELVVIRANGIIGDTQAIYETKGATITGRLNLGEI